MSLMCAFNLASNFTEMRIECMFIVIFNRTFYVIDKPEGSFLCIPSDNKFVLYCMFACIPALDCEKRCCLFQPLVLG